MKDPEIWWVSGSMQHPSEPDRKIDGYDFYIEIKGVRYRINSKELEQFKLENNDN